MIDLNYELKLKNISKCKVYWKRRKLTPIGRITVVKSLLVPLLTHLFISLPSPKIDFIKRLNDLLYNFVWDGSAKIKKKKIFIKNYEEGGMKIIDIKSFNVSMKLKWLKNLINCKPNKCYQLVYDTMDVRKIMNLGKTYSELIWKVIKNDFWIDVLKS